MYEINTTDPLIDSKQAAEFLGGIHPKTLQRMARKEEVPAHFFAGKWFFRKSELENWLSNSTHVTSTATAA